MTRITQILATLIAVASLSGCVIVGGEHGWNHGDDWQEQQEHNRKVISELDIGTERSVVMDRLGAPNFSEAYTREGDEYRVLFYRTQHQHSDGSTSKDECTPLVFRNNLLIGWGQQVYASIK